MWYNSFNTTSSFLQHLLNRLYISLKINGIQLSNLLYHERDIEIAEHIITFVCKQ